VEAVKVWAVKETGKKYNKSYNAIRGFAAVGIFLFHMSYLRDSDVPFWRELYNLIFRHGLSWYMSGLVVFYVLFWLVTRIMAGSGYKIRKRLWGGILTCIVAYIS
jgi:hypothetical protein